MQKKSLHLIIILILLSTSTYGEAIKSFRVSGKVMNAQTKSPLPGANIIAKQNKTGAASDSIGAFSIILRTPRDTLEISFIGFEKLQAYIDFQNGEKEKNANYYLIPTSIAGEPVHVSAEHPAAASTFEISPTQLRMMSSPLPDAMLSLKTLPGVTASNDQTSFYNVRGGNYNENLIYINGFEIQQLQTVRKGYLENPSLVNPYMLSSFVLQSGAIPVQNGDKLSSSLNVEYKPTKDKLSSAVDIRTIGVMGAVSYKKNDNFYINVGLRKIDYGYLMSSMPLQGAYQPDYTDMQAALFFRLSASWSIEALLANADSKFRVTPKYWEYKTLFLSDYSMSFDAGREGFDFLTRFGGVRLTRSRKNLKLLCQYSLFNQQETEKTSLKYIFREYRETEDEIRTIDSTLIAQNSDSRFHGLYHNLKLQFSGSANTFKFNGGYEYKPFTIVYDIAQFQSIDYWRYKQAEHFSNANTYEGATHALFLNGVFQILRNTWLDVGVRQLFVASSREQIFMPRLSMRHTLSTHHILTASAGRHAQPPLYKEFGFQKMNASLRSQKADIYTLGFESHFSSLQLKSEAYYKKLHDLISYNVDDVQVRYSGDNDSRGKIYGIDAYLHWQPRPNIVHWISYSYLVARENLTDDHLGYVPMPTDRRHQLAFFTEDYMDKHHNSKMHMRIIFGSGFPYTSYQYHQNDETGELVTIEGRRNAARLPAYARFDIGYTQEFILFGTYRLVLREEILNLFNHFNVLSIETTPWNKTVKHSLSGRVFNLGAMIEL